MHLHNLDIEGLAGAMSNPHVAFRWEQIKVRPVDFERLKQSLNGTTHASEEAEVTDKLDRLALSAHKCPLCEEMFGEEDTLNTHVSTVHPETHSSNPRACAECAKVLGSAQSLIRHITTVHRTCKSCKVVFESSAELQLHKPVHTTCELCGTDWGFVSKLKKHMESHKLPETRKVAS